MDTASHGSDLRSFARNGVRVSETLLPAGLRLGPHAHDDGQICFVLEGAYRERLASGERALRPGLVHVRAPGEPHANVFSSDVLTLLISIEPSRWIDAPLERPVRTLGFVAAELRDELRRGDASSGPALEALGLLSLARVARLPRRAPEPAWLADAVSIIERRYAGPLSLATLAREVGVARGPLAAAFRRHRATSVGDAIRAVRVARARELLATATPLAEVALACGFHDQSHLTRVFAAATGETPGAYRSRT
jgi:AraC family transcriptional regulator